MVFLVDFNRIHSNPLILLDVQNAVFEHFSDLRVHSRELDATKSLHEAVEEAAHEERACVCTLIPNVNITPDDLSQYWHLLTSVSSTSGSDFTNHTSSGTRKRKEPAKFGELQAIHERITKAQVAIQQQLLRCELCAHSVLPSESESMLLEFLSEVQPLRWNKSERPIYALHEEIKNLTTTAASLRYRSIEAYPIYKLIVPVAGEIRFTHSNELKQWMSSNAKRTSSATTNYTPSSVVNELGPVVILPESVLIMLFAPLPSEGVFIPFTISEIASSHKTTRRKLHLDDAIWSCPPEPRERARLFYGCAAQFYYYRYEQQQRQPPPATPTGIHGKPDDASTPSNRTPTTFKTVDRPLVGSVDEKKKPYERKSARLAERYKQTEPTGLAVKSVVDQTAEPKSSAPHTPRSNPKERTSTSKHSPRKNTVAESPMRRSHRRTAPYGSSQTTTLDPTNPEHSDEETEVEIEVGNLSIDLTPLDAVISTDLTMDLSTLRREVVSTCTVVTPVVPRVVSNHNSAVTDISGPASPTCDAPASPSSSLAEDPAPAAPDQNQSPVPRVIPLEPVQSTPRCSSSPISPIRETLSDFQSAPDLLDNVPPPRSFATLELGQKTVLVQYDHTVWSPEQSCLACCCSSSELEPTGQCSLWPSCDSLKERWTDQQHQSESNTNNDLRPVYVQIKPEYLGEWGCEVLSPYELAEAWLGSMIRNKADILRIRVRVDSGEVIWVEYQSLDDLLSSNPNLKPEVNVGAVSALFDKLISLSPGSYLLSRGTTPDSYKIFRSIEEQDLHMASKSPESDQSSLLDLHSQLESFVRLSSSVCSVGEDKDEMTVCVAVQRAMLDLDIPAGLELKSSNPGRALRLPALPVSRIPSQPERSSINAQTKEVHAPEGTTSKRPRKSKKSKSHPKPRQDKSKESNSSSQVQPVKSRQTKRTVP